MLSQCKSPRGGWDGQIESAGKLGCSHGPHSDNQSEFSNFLIDGNDNTRSAPGQMMAHPAGMSRGTFRPKKCIRGFLVLLQRY